MSLYRKIKRAFNRGYGLRRFLSRKILGNLAKKIDLLIRILLIIGLAFLFSGAILAITYPLPPEVLFTRGSGGGMNYQALVETIVYFVMIVIAFIGIFLMEKGVKKPIPDVVIFSIGTMLFVGSLLLLLHIITNIKLIRIF